MIVRKEENMDWISSLMQMIIRRQSSFSSTTKLHDQNCTTSEPQTSSDRISDLPDDIILHILSLVPTKQAVETSILSKRWLSLWTLVPVLDFEDNSSGSESESAYDEPYSNLKPLAEFVDKAFQFNKAKPLVKLRLTTNPGHGWCIPNCIRTATERGALQELDISLPTSLFLCELCVLSSKSFNEIGMLKVLKLGNGIILDAPPGISFPNLRTLHLVSVNYRNNGSARNLFSACLVVEDLIVKRTYTDYGVHLNISISTLKSLFLEYNSGFRGHTFEINAPVLEYLDLKDNIYGAYSPDSVVQIQSCFLEVSCSVKSLSFTSMSWDNNMGRTDSNLLFVNLVRFKLNVGLKNWDLLMLFLKNSHVLRVFELTLSAGLKNSDFVWFKNFSCIGCRNPWKPLPDHVPTCFLSSLETVRFRKFAALEHELQLIEYILTNARMLKTMAICGYDRFLCSAVQKKLSLIPMCSKFCQLEFKSQPYK